MTEPVQLTERQRELVTQNAALIYFVAARYRGVPATTFEDLTGRLYHRLCLCIARFDPGLGFRISPYIVRSLEGEAKNYFRDEIWTVKPPRRLREISMASEADRLLEAAGHNPQTIESCARPVCLDLLAERAPEDGQQPLLGEPPVDVETQVVNRLATVQLLRELFAWLRPEERYILALQMRRRPLADLAVRFQLTQPQARAIWAELQGKVKRAYYTLIEGEPLGLSQGNRELARLLRRRFVPENASFVTTRQRLTRS